MKNLLYIVLLAALNTATAEILPFDLIIRGADVSVKKLLILSDVGEAENDINFDFSTESGKKYSFDLKYKKLPINRSYPSNLDITLKDAKGNKLGYLFFANNSVSFLKQMGTFGFIVDVEGKPIDIKFVFDKNVKGNLKVADLEQERFVQDTLVSKFNFQMIRPVILPLVQPGLRSVTYSLDDHPYAVNYTVKDIENGLVQFQHNLYQLKDGKEQLLERIYYHADSLKTLREAMFAGKYFHKDDGAFKLVFYPALGQTEPEKIK